MDVKVEVKRLDTKGKSDKKMLNTTTGRRKLEKNKRKPKEGGKR